MKLLLENWRKFVKEEMEEPITTLRIFDFDETITHTRSNTYVTDPNGNEKTLRNQKEFEDYMKKAAKAESIETFDPVRDLQALGYDINLKDFSIVKEPDEITVVTDILRNFPENSKTYILTARRGNSIGPIIDYLNDIGIDTKVNDVRVMATQGESKGDVMVAMMKNKIMNNGKSNINRIEYYEDSEKNIADVKTKVCDNEEINSLKPEDFQLVIYKVVKNEGHHIIQQIEC